jgi:acetyl-CoA carboxylase biotin carboxyl carrier protein
MLTFEQIKELIELVAERQIGGVELERSGFRLEITGRREAPAPHLHAAAPPAPPQAPAASAESAGAAAAVPEAAEAGVHVLTSPIVGTFYRAAAPDADPFVDVGDRVEPGQVLCIVEAMKLMNEIEADVAGTVVSVHPKNAQPVEYGEPLFSIRPG